MSQDPHPQPQPHCPHCDHHVPGCVFQDTPCECRFHDINNCAVGPEGRLQCVLVRIHDLPLLYPASMESLVHYFYQRLLVAGAPAPGGAPGPGGAPDG